MSVNLTLPYNDSDNYLVDLTKVLFSGSNVLLKLINNPGQNFIENFDSETGFTYDSNLSEFSASKNQQKNKRPANALFYASYTIDENASWSIGSEVGTLHNGASIDDGTLDCQGANEYVEYENTGNVGLNVGTINIRFSVPYSGNPASNNFIYCEAIGAGSNNHNAFYLLHQAGGNLQLYAFNNAGSLILAKNLGVWSPTADQIYTFSLNYDFSSDVRLFIDGTQQGTTGNPSDVRTSFVGKILLGTGLALTEESYVKYYDVLFYSTVQHTSNYTTSDWDNIYEYDYIETNVILPEMEWPGPGTLISFDNLIYSIGGNVRLTLQIERSGNYLWYNIGTSQWEVSDETYEQATEFSIFLVNVGTLPVVGKKYGQFQVHYTNSFTQGWIDTLTASLTAQIYSTIPQKVPFVNTTRLQEILAITEAPASQPSGSSIKYTTEVGAVEYWYDSGWKVSNGTTEFNTLAEILANIDTLVVSPNAYNYRLVPYLISDDGTVTPSLDQNVITYNSSASIDTIGRCTVKGNFFDITGTPELEPFTVNISYDIAKYKTYSGIRDITPKTVTPDPDGSFEVEIVETENLPSDVKAIWNFGRVKYTSDIPDQDEENFWDLTNLTRIV